jgi:hypothetical protein
VGTGNAATRDPYSPFDNAFNGNYMAQLNEFVPVNGAGSNTVTRISQLATMLAGETDIFINWAAVMEDPSHPLTDEPFFNITINKNGNLFAQENHVANAGAGAGWTAGPTGPDGSPTYYSSGQFHVAGLTAGDQVQVVLTVADCGQGGHAAWAYLDGIGTTVTQPPPGVPDGGSTIAMFGLALGGLVVLRRKLAVA